MELHKSVRLSLEVLEDRSVPAVTASVVHGSLVVVGDQAAPSNLSITASDTNGDKVADTFTVVDGSTTVGTFGGVTKDVVLRLSNNDDSVSIDLAGLSTPRNVRANLGDGTNSLTITDGTVNGSLGVRGGAGTDTVTLDGSAPLTVNGNAFVNLGGSADDVLRLTGGATVKGNLAGFSANDVTLDAGSTVGGSVFLHGGSGGNTVNLDGTVAKDVIFSGGQFGSTAGSTLNLAGTVEGNVFFLGSNQADTLNATGTVGGNLIAHLGGGDDTATVSGTVTGHLLLDGGPGNDTLTLGGAVGGRTVVRGGAGDDTLTIGPGARLTGPATVNLGTGNDTLTLDDSATISTLLANGGPGTDTFVGTRTRPGLTLIGFES